MMFTLANQFLVNTKNNSRLYVCKSHSLIIVDNNRYSIMPPQRPAAFGRKQPFAERLETTQNGGSEG